ncbi:hypothetical protein SLE2022_225570 [Rubroshorea leprosula]
MGLFSWFRGSPKQQTQPVSKPTESTSNPKPVPGMNGAVEVPIRGSVTVFEFGTAEAATMVGYCPVSEELEPCRWGILPASGSNAPQFRVIF